MIKFQILRYKNFLSSGNYWTEIKLDQHNATLIVGHNGAGKSTILDALTFVLFNKPFRKINKNQLINSVNEKDCLVEVELSISGKQYTIKRGIKPTLFEIYRDGVLLDQSSSSNDQQKWLEQSALKLNYKSFTQIVILGSSNFVPFMQLSSQHRREVVEDLLDIKVFSSMNDVAKIKIKELKDEIREVAYKKENLEDKIESQQDLIEKLKKRKTEDIQSRKTKLVSLDTEIDSIVKDNETIHLQVEKNTKKLETISFSEDLLKKLEKLNAKIEQKITNLVDEHKFFNNNRVCPTCTQNIEEDFRLNKIEQIHEKSKEVQKGQKELEQSIETEKKKQHEFLQITKEVTQLTNEINFNNVKISGLRKQIQETESEIQTLATRNQDTDTEYEKLTSLTESLESILQDSATKKEELQNYEFISLLLKDDGAKSKIIQKYLPVINSNLNKYLEILDFPVNFTLDEEFNEKSLNPIYEDFSYSSFSEGEKMRIDLALLFTWREVAKVKNSINTNLLILDEVFDSSLDEAGTDYFTKIIKFVVKDSNTFVISHKVDDLLEKFEKTIKFEKRKGFSMMVDAD
jgi:DNA repair exonuclease SbcCD ATPase subunit